MAVNRFAEEHSVEWKSTPKFKADVCTIGINDTKIILVKSHTFYNNTGEAVRAAADFYKIDPADILAIHDELALPFGSVRTRLGGSDAGNNGIKSLSSHLGASYARVRVGIENDLRARMDAADFVLARFTAEEMESLPTILATTSKLINAFCGNNFTATTHLH
jgi:PTH1 family peptidyl-tRNA hydrolase